MSTLGRTDLSEERFSGEQDMGIGSYMTTGRDERGVPSCRAFRDPERSIGEQQKWR